MPKKPSPLIRTLVLAIALAGVSPLSAAEFTYRGSLSDRGVPAEGAYGFRLTPYDASVGGKALAPATTLDGVALAAIQGLNEKLERENAQLRERLERLEQVLSPRTSPGN